MSYLEDEDSKSPIFSDKAVGRRPLVPANGFGRNPMHEEVRMGGDHGTPMS